ncbi:MAG: hypothetical protein SVR04_15710 [Spirochaetota bacterium]|nr:hypothetical protein [Spirochaetota bacterium]
MLRKTILLLLVVTLCSPAALVAQDMESDGINENIDIDSLFGEVSGQDEGQDQTACGETEEEGGAAEKAGEDVKKPDDASEGVLKELQQDSLTFRLDYRFSAGYSPGWIMESSDYSQLSSAEFNQLALADFNSKFSLDFRPTDHFRAYQSFQFEYPDFEWEVLEFFGDYSAAGRVFFRFGIQKVTWGISRTFPFTDLSARLPNDFEDSEDNSTRAYSLKTTVPVGIGGVELLALTRNGFMEDPEHPSVDEIGAGAKVNFANSLFDLNVGTYYHDALSARTFYSLKTTLFDSIDLYHEGMLKPANRAVSANLGVYWDLFDADLKVNMEHFYCGEKEELELVDSSYPLYHGHNSALILSAKIGSKITLLFQGMYNWNQGSMMLLPAVRMKPLDDIQLYCAVPMVLGPSAGGYYLDNTDPEDRRLSIVLGAQLSDTFIKGIK